MDDENIDEAEKKTNECEEIVVDNAGDKKEVIYFFWVICIPFFSFWKMKAGMFYFYFIISIQNRVMHRFWSG